jgi:alkaline phosphatase D
MKRRSVLRAIATVPAIPKLFSQSGTAAWLGPEFWANPLQDWRKSGPKTFECHVSGGDRNVYWLTREVSPKGMKTSVQLKLTGDSPGWAGFRIGVRGHFNDYRDSAVRGLGLEAGLTHDGRLFIGNSISESQLLNWRETDLSLSIENNTATLSANGKSHQAPIAAEHAQGGIALVCHHGQPALSLPAWREPQNANSGKPNQARGGNFTASFTNWTLSGPGVTEHPDRAWGPILFTQYTLSRDILKLTAQFAPLEGNEGPATLRIGRQQPVSVTPETYSSTATFRISQFDSSRAHPYEVRLGEHTYKGTIAADPVSQDRIQVASLTCQGDFGFPHTAIAANLDLAKPDLLLFTGDQLYEANGGYGIERGPLATARLDYLRKWYLFGWAWGKLTRDIPCVCLPDDHDVYHGNLWGASGRKAEFPAPGSDENPDQGAQDSGGYKMPSAWVNMVQRTQTSHLPDPADPKLVDQDITVHFTSLDWGGVSFALLEDRKFKSAPRGLMPEARIRNGWPQNPNWDAAKQGDVPGAHMLGDRQEAFLAEWAKRWDGIEMKAVVSATIFCNLCTLPETAMSDNVTSRLIVEPFRGYAKNEKLTMDHDSNAWPQTARNRALRLIRGAVAVHLAGDQHLASTIQYGIDSHGDAPFALCSPAISNIFPRRWYPPLKKPTDRDMGDFQDGFGNRMTVYAVANPQLFSKAKGVTPAALQDRAPGFALATFQKSTRTITLASYPRWADLSKPNGQTFDGWPITIKDEDNGLSKAKYELPLPKPINGVVEVHLGQEHIYSWRTPGPRRTLAVWQPGEYTIKSGTTTHTVTARPRKTDADA